MQHSRRFTLLDLLASTLKAIVVTELYVTRSCSSMAVIGNIRRIRRATYRSMLRNIQIGVRVSRLCADAEGLPKSSRQSMCQLAEPRETRVFPGHKIQPQLRRPRDQLLQHFVRLCVVDGQRLYLGRRRSTVCWSVFLR